MAPKLLTYSYFKIYWQQIVIVFKSRNHSSRAWPKMRWFPALVGSWRFPACPSDTVKWAYYIYRLDGPPHKQHLCENNALWLPQLQKQAPRVSSKVVPTCYPWPMSMLYRQMFIDYAPYLSVSLCIFCRVEIIRALSQMFKQACMIDFLLAVATKRAKL